MVVKTDKCAFSEFNIFPGHGMKCVKRDGTPLMLINRKSKSLMTQRKKPAKLTWTLRAFFCVRCDSSQAGAL